MKLLRYLMLALGMLLLWPLNIAAAQSSPTLTLDSFNGVYHLSRDSRGLSLLTSEEAITADFGSGSNFSGITRQIPETYQGHSVNVQVLSVTDAAGDPMPYKTASQNNNLVLTIGDPAITLYGSQIFHITYHSTGVIDLRQKSDQFLLDINGRGWSQPFGTVSATLYIARNFQAKLVGQPSCYLGRDNQTSPCQISSKQTGQSTVLSSEAHNLAPNQTMVLKMAFQPATFTNNHKAWVKPVLIIIGVTLAVLILVGILIDSFWPAKKIT